jgi:hypothetical protein
MESNMPDTVRFLQFRENLCKDAIERSYSAQSLVLTCILNLIVAVAGIFVIGRLFEQEKIINQ